MEPRRLIRTDIAASALAHLTLVALVIVISEVHPFLSRPPETVSVDIVTPEQAKAEEEKAKEKAETVEKSPTPDLQLPKFDISEQTAPAPKPADKPQASQQQPQQQQKPPQPAQATKPPEAATPQQQSSPPPQNQQPPDPQAPAQPQPEPQAAPPAAYQTPQPDVTVKYGVMLGLPPELPLPLPKDAPKDDGGDAKDSVAAKLPPEIVAELRRHVRGCAKLPAGLGPGDNVQIKLRTVFTTDGMLAREPILIEAPPSAKGVALMKTAMSALQACQPYKMLPPDKYGEWKVLDLRFSPGDFAGG